jgi:pyruvate dehydrogenase E1 component
VILCGGNIDTGKFVTVHSRVGCPEGMCTTHLKTIEQRLLWLSHWMIHNANHIRPRRMGSRWAGTRPQSASMVSIMTALYFSALRPEDRVAVKPHASPVFHAMQYLMGQQTREKLEAFRGFGGVQSYPSRTKDIDDVDFSTGSVGLGVAITAPSRRWCRTLSPPRTGARDVPMGRMVALVGDAELDEGNVYEALQEGWKNDLRNTWWIIDYNRQSLDGMVREGTVRTHREDLRRLRLGCGAGQIRRAATRGLCRTRRREAARLDRRLPQPALFGADLHGRRGLAQTADGRSGRSGRCQRADRPAFSDTELAALMENLGGNCVSTMAETFAAIDHDRPTCFPGLHDQGLGHADRRAQGQPRRADEQDADGRMAAHMGVPEGQEWDPIATVRTPTVCALSGPRCRSLPKAPALTVDAKLPVPAIAFSTDARDLDPGGVWQDPR